jgi:hypothetical protein
MTLRARLVNGTIRGITRILCRVDDAELTRVPERGPLILVANHVNFLEVPLIYTHLTAGDRLCQGGTWDNPAALFDLWEIILSSAGADRTRDRAPWRPFGPARSLPWRRKAREAGTAGFSVDTGAS